MPQNGRWIIGLVAGVVLLGVFAWRHGSQQSEPETPVAPARVPPRNKNAGLPGSATGGPQGTRFDQSADAGDENAPIAAGERMGAGGKGIPASGVPAMKRAAPGAPAPGQGQTGQGEAPADEAGEAPGTGTPDAGPALSVSFKDSLNSADQAPPLVAEGIELDPTSGAAHFPPTARLAYPDSGGVNPAEGTVTMWVRMELDPNQTLNKPLLELRTSTWENRFELNMGPKYIGLLLASSDGVEQTVGVSMRWAPGDWHHVATSWGEDLMSIYVDGVLGDQKPYTGSVLIPPGTPLYVGSSRAGPKQEHGSVSLRGLNVFQRILSPEEIATIASQDPPPQ